MGNISDGESIKLLARFYAQTIHSKFGDQFDNLYGPAYKGIPLVVSTAQALFGLYKKKVTFTFNRKEKKGHGEGGELIGHQYQDGDRTIILEDVMTAGTSIYESVPLIKSAANVQLKGIMIAVDREEKGDAALSAKEEIESKFGFPVMGITTISTIIKYLSENKVNGRNILEPSQLEALHQYRNQYGTK